MPNPLKISISWSGGKDSAFALYQLLQSDHYEIQSLHTVFDADLKRVGLHGIREHLIEAQARSLRLPLEKIYLLKDDNSNIYEQVMTSFYKSQKRKGIECIMFGDIFLEDLKAYRDQLLKSADLKGVYPLWNQKTDQIMNYFMKEGFRTLVCSADASIFQKNQVGKTIDQGWVEQLPSDTDPCGENGEFHTFIFDGPLFRKPIPFKSGEIVKKSYDYKMTNEDGSVSALKRAFWFQDLE